MKQKRFLIGDIGDGSGNDGSGDDGSGGEDTGSGDGSLLSISFEDLNGDGAVDKNDTVGLDDNLTVNVRANSCDGPIIRQTDLANLSVLGLDAGQFCVELDTGLDAVSPSTRFVDVPDNGGNEVDVGLTEDILGNGSPDDDSTGDDSSGEDDSGGLLDGLLP